MEEKKWAEAGEVLKTLISLNPNDCGSDGALAMLARVHRELGDTASEQSLLMKLAAIDSAVRPVVSANSLNLVNVAS